MNTSHSYSQHVAFVVNQLLSHARGSSGYNIPRDVEDTVRSVMVPVIMCMPADIESSLSSSFDPRYGLTIRWCWGSCYLLVDRSGSLTASRSTNDLRHTTNPGSVVRALQTELLRDSRD